jgi:hypothetical protein
MDPIALPEAHILPDLSAAGRGRVHSCLTVHIGTSTGQTVRLGTSTGQTVRLGTSTGKLRTTSLNCIPLSAVTMSPSAFVGPVRGTGQGNPARARCCWTTMQPAIRESHGRALTTTRLPSASSVATWERCPQRNSTRTSRAPG